MADLCGAEGIQGKLGTGDALEVDNLWEMGPAGESLALQTSKINSNALNGTTQQFADDTRESIENVAGDLNLFATPRTLDWFGPRTFAGGAKGTTDPDYIDLGDDVPPEFVTTIDRDALVFDYLGCRINRMTLRGQVNGFVEMITNIIGTTEVNPVRAAGSFPALDLVPDPPYTFEDGEVIVNGVAYEFTEFELIIDNKLQPRFTGNRTACGIKRSEKLEITLRISHPFDPGTTADLYRMPEAPQFVPVNLNFTQGPYSARLEMPAVQFENNSPTISGPGDIPLVFEGQARALKGPPIERALRLFNDSTP